MKIVTPWRLISAINSSTRSTKIGASPIVGSPADRGGGEALQAGLGSDRPVDVRVVHADQDAADAGQAGRDREGQRLDDAGVDAHLPGRVAVLGGRPDRPAEAVALEEEPERGDAQDRDGQDREVEPAEMDRAD